MKLEAGGEQPGQIAQLSVLVLFYFLKGCSKMAKILFGNRSIPLSSP